MTPDGDQHGRNREQKKPGQVVARRENPAGPPTGPPVPPGAHLRLDTHCPSSSIASSPRPNSVSRNRAIPDRRSLEDP